MKITEYLPPESRTLYDYLTAGTPLHWLDSKRLAKEKAIYQQYTSAQQAGFAATGAIIGLPKKLLILSILNHFPKIKYLREQSYKKLENEINKLTATEKVIVGVIIAPVMEEIIMRGIGQNLIKKVSNSSTIQIGLIHTIFTLAHGWRGTHIFLTSGLTSILYHHSQKLSVCVTAHATNNLIFSLFPTLERKP